MDQQTAACIMELDDEIQALWRTLKHHSDAAEFSESARRHQAEADRIHRSVEEYSRDFERMTRNLSEESVRYINSVSVIGYTAYFATWAFTKGSMTAEQHALVGLLGMLSVATFVLWEMFQGFIRMHAISEISALFRSGMPIEDFEKAKADQLSREAKRIAILNPIHKLVFIFSAGCASFGGLMLMHLLYSSLR